MKGLWFSPEWGSSLHTCWRWGKWFAIWLHKVTCKGDMNPEKVGIRQTWKTDIHFVALIPRISIFWFIILYNFVNLNPILFVTVHKESFAINLLCKSTCNYCTVGSVPYPCKIKWSMHAKYKQVWPTLSCWSLYL